ncbi:MAG: carbohydrate ABC transporter permease [Acetivibrionales bacterium]|jgi:multiple sugar transport system permease protein
MNKKEQLKTDIKGLLFILPSLSGFLFFVVVPVLFSLGISFCEWDYTKGLSGIHFNFGVNYLEMWKDDWFLVSLKNTILFSLGFVPTVLVLALFISIIIDRYLINKRICQLFFFMPYISNIVAVSIVWVVMLSSSGPITMLISSLGIENPPKWLGNTATALPSIIVMSVWLNLGYLIMIYTAALQLIPKDMYEAAEIDGANGLQQLFRITIPMLKPTTFFLLITTIINSFKVFGQVKIMTAGGPGNATSVLVYHIYTSAFTFYNMGYASAMSWVLFIILFTMTLIQMRGQKKWSI